MLLLLEVAILPRGEDAGRLCWHVHAWHSWLPCNSLRLIPCSTALIGQPLTAVPAGWSLQKGRHLGCQLQYSVHHSAVCLQAGRVRGGGWGVGGELAPDFTCACHQVAVLTIYRHAIVLLEMSYCSGVLVTRTSCVQVHNRDAICSADLVQTWCRWWCVFALAPRHVRKAHFFF